MTEMTVEEKREALALVDSLRDYAMRANLEKAQFFADAIVQRHRTEQQRMMLLLMRVVLTFSKSDSDMRNVATVNLAKKLVGAAGEDLLNLPFI